MPGGDKHHLEGLLKARSQDLRSRPRTRTPPTVAASPWPIGPEDVAQGPESTRRCVDCAAAIAGHRLRAMPRAERCLACQRAAERALART